MTEPQRKPVLYAVVCAAGIASDVGRLITAAQERGWEVGVLVIATPQAIDFLDCQAIEEQIGHPIRSVWRSPGDARSYPRADAIAVAPATFNTVDKWAAGFADNLARGIPCEAPGRVIPAVVLPYVNTALAAHRAHRRSVEELREMGVAFGSDVPHRPKSGGGADRLLWEEAVDLLAPQFLHVARQQ